MTNAEMLANIEYLRERADVSYEEAQTLLERYDGNVMRALIELEHQGRVYGQEPTGETEKDDWKHAEAEINDGWKKAKSFADKAMQTRLIVEKKKDDKTEMIANVPVPFAVLTAIAAPWLAIGALGVGFVTGHTARIEKEKTEEKNA